MKRRFVLGMMLATIVPVAALAQTPASPYSSSERVLQSATEQPTPLPVTLDLNTPADNEWVQRVNANPSLKTNSKAEAALQANVGGQQPAPAAAAPTPVYGVTGCDTCGSGNGNGQNNTGLGHRVKGAITSVIGETGPVREWLRNFEPNVYHKGVISVEFGSQYLRSPIWLASDYDTKMVPLITRVGIMLNEPDPNRRLKGVFELMGEVDTIPIVQGAGTIIVGGSGILRYHRVRNHRIVPYFHVGFGGVYTDSAGLVGSPTTSNFNFITQFASGSHIFLNKKWAIMTESSYTMIHNFGIGEGPGYHILGGLAGITRYFGGSDCNCR